MEGIYLGADTEQEPKDQPQELVLAEYFSKKEKKNNWQSII